MIAVLIPDLIIHPVYSDGVPSTIRLPKYPP